MPEKTKSDPFYISVDKAAEMLGRTAPAVRQLLQRGKLPYNKTAQGKVQVDINHVLTFHARRLRLKALEEHIEDIRGKVIVSLPEAASRLGVRESYALYLAQKGYIQAYVDSDGHISVTVDSINDRQRAPKNVANDL